MRNQTYLSLKKNETISDILKKIRETKHAFNKSKEDIPERQRQYTQTSNYFNTQNHKNKSNLGRYTESEDDSREIRGYKLDAAALIGDRLVKLFKNIYSIVSNHNKESTHKELIADTIIVYLSPAKKKGHKEFTLY